jgi:hypothetical protein
MKTKQNEKQTWIGGDKKAGDDDRRTPPEHEEGPTSAEVVTNLPFYTFIFVLHSIPRPATPLPVVSNSTYQPSASLSPSHLSLLANLFGFLQHLSFNYAVMFNILFQYI